MGSGALFVGDGEVVAVGVVGIASLVAQRVRFIGAKLLAGVIVRTKEPFPCLINILKIECHIARHI